MEEGVGGWYRIEALGTHHLNMCIRFLRILEDEIEGACNFFKGAVGGFGRIEDGSKQECLGVRVKFGL